MVKQVTLYVADDGTYHETELDAKRHNAYNALLDYVNKNPIIRDADGIALHLWLQEHPRIYMTLLSEEDGDAA